MYAPLMGSSQVFRGLMKKLNHKIKQDLINHEEMIKSLGALEQIFSMATPKTELQTSDHTIGDLTASVSSDGVDSIAVETPTDVDLKLLPETSVSDNSSKTCNGLKPSQTTDGDVDFNIDASSTRILID